MWQTNSNFVRPNLSIEGAHSKGTETGSIVFGVDGRTVLTRGGDDTVKCTSYYSCPRTCLTVENSMGFTFIQEATSDTFRSNNVVPDHQCDS